MQFKQLNLLHIIGKFVTNIFDGILLHHRVNRIALDNSDRLITCCVYPLILTHQDFTCKVSFCSLILLK